LGSLHQKLKIVFPGKLFPIKNITDEMKLLEGSILEMGSEIVKAVIEPNPDILSINKRIEELNKKNSTIIEKVTKEVAAIENTIIEILNRKAHELGIKE
jgi:hypothetical protein